jgi:plasmid stability protein
MPKQTKTLNIDEDLHAVLRVNAANERTRLADYVEAVLKVGLSRPKEIKRLLATDTTPEPPPGKR